jgi:multiple sugar transport system substrate-binding protein
MVKYDSRGKIDRMGLLPLNLHHWAAVWGGEFYDAATGRITANHPRIVEALEWMTTYSRKYDVNKVSSFQAGLTQQVGDSWPFVKKKFALIQDGQWRVEDLKKFAPDIEYRVTPLPYPPGGHPRACHVNGNFLIIPRGARHAREAWEFAKFWCGWQHEEAGAEIATWGGWIPASPALTRTAPYRRYVRENPAFQTFLDVIASPNVRITPVMPVQAFLWDRLKATEEAALRLKQTPREALDQMTYEAQRELDKLNRHRG